MVLAYQSLSDLESAANTPVESRIDSEEALIPENVIRRLPEEMMVYFELNQVVRILRTAPVRTTQAHNFAEDERFCSG